MVQEIQTESNPFRTPNSGEGFTAANIIRWAGAVASVGLVLGIAYWTFQLGQRDALEVPVIRAMNGLARITPDNPQGTQADHQGLAVNTVLAGDATEQEDEVSLAPDTQGLSAEDESMSSLDNTDGMLHVDAASVLTEITSELVTEAVVAPGEATTSNVAEDPLLTDQAGPIFIPKPRSAADGMTLPIRRPDAFGSVDAMSDEIEGLLQEVLPQEGGTSQTVPEQQRLTTPYGNPVLDPGSALVQLGAFNSAEDAANAWMKFQDENNDLLAERKRVIAPIETGGRVLFQLWAAGFEGVNETNILCETIRARGVDCISITIK